MQTWMLRTTLHCVEKSNLFLLLAADRACTVVMISSSGSAIPFRRKHICYGILKHFKKIEVYVVLEEYRCRAFIKTCCSHTTEPGLRHSLDHRNQVYETPKAKQHPSHRMLPYPDLRRIAGMEQRELQGQTARATARW